MPVFLSKSLFQARGTEGLGTEALVGALLSPELHGHSGHARTSAGSWSVRTKATLGLKQKPKSEDFFAEKSPFAVYRETSCRRGFILYRTVCPSRPPRLHP